jgi:hypothetical protein
LKEKFYRTIVRSAMLYGTECWAVKNQHQNKVKHSRDEDVAFDVW